MINSHYKKYSFGRMFPKKKKSSYFIFLLEERWRRVGMNTQPLSRLCPMRLFISLPSNFKPYFSSEKKKSNQTLTYFSQPGLVSNQIQKLEPSSFPFLSLYLSTSRCRQIQVKRTDARRWLGGQSKGGKHGH